MKKGMCLISLGAALVGIHAIMIKRAIELEQECGCLYKCDNTNNETYC